MIRLISAPDLMATEFEPLRFIVDDLLTPGLTLLAGPPKIGKSWLALQLAYAVATGGSFLGRSTIQGEVFYLGLEDDSPRLQRRLSKQSSNGEIPPQLFFSTSAPNLKNGLIEELDKLLTDGPGVELLIIDTYGRIRPTGRGSTKVDYAESIELLAPIHDLALRHQVAVVLVHHTRKPSDGSERGDPLERILGSQGQTATVDTGMVLDKDNKSGRPSLYVRGRDIEEKKMALLFSADTCQWEQTSPPLHERLDVSLHEGKIIEAVSQGHDTPSAIKKAIGNTSNSVDNALRSLVDSGKLRREKQGIYRVGGSLTTLVGVHDTENLGDPAPQPEVSESGESHWTPRETLQELDYHDIEF